MSVLFRTAPRVEQRDVLSAPWVNGETVPSPLQSTGGAYSYVPDEAFKIAAVTACVGLRSGALAQIPLKSYDVAAMSVETVPQPDLLANPSVVVVPSVSKIQMSISRDIWGFAAGKIVAVDAGGYPSKVEWLLPSKVTGWQDHVGGPLRWKFGQSEVDAGSILHVPSRWVTPGNPLGMSPLERSGLVNLAKRAQEFGRDWFVNGAVPSSIIYSDQVLTGEQANSILTTILTKWRQRKPAILGAGLRYEKISVPANESQFLETIRQAASDIAVSFNLPPAKIAAAVSGSAVEYSNITQNTQQFLMDSINPDLVVVQESYGRHMRPGTVARWSTGGFLRSDLAARYASYQVGLAGGWITVDEIREWEELGPMKGGQL